MIQSALVRDTIVFRKQALALLTGAIDSRTFVDATSQTGARVWRFFLAAEACATPLRSRIGAWIHSLRPEIKVILDESCAAELQRMLAADMQLRLIDRAAVLSDTAPIVLKGAVPIAEGKHAFDLGDVDLLVLRDELDPLRRTLIALGASADGELRFQGTLKTELHSKLDYGPGVVAASSVAARPLSRFARLRRLENVAHAAYVTQHCTTHHVERRGNSRDLMLLADVLRDFSADEIEQLRAQLNALPDRDLYARFLNRALAASREEGVNDDPQTALVVAAHYAFSERWPRDDRFISTSLRLMATWFLGPSRDMSRAVRNFLLNKMLDESRWLAHPFAKRAPRFWRGVAYVVRTPYRLALLTYAASVAIRFRLDYDGP